MADLEEKFYGIIFILAFIAVLLILVGNLLIGFLGPPT